MNSFNKLVTFAKNLARDTRGEDLTDTSSNLSRAGKVVIAGSIITATAAGAATAANNANHASDTTGKNINGAAGAQADQTTNTNSAFGGGASH